MLPSWSVVATVDEPAALVVAFALHHLNIGAAEVHIFLDGPNPEAQEALSAIPQVQVTLCDAAYWAASVRRRNPVLHTGRQQVNADIAYGRTKAEWLLHCDCDEFVRDGAAMAQELTTLEPKHVYLRLKIAERVYVRPEGLAQNPEDDSIFSGIFRYHLDNFAEVGPALYGDLVPFLRDGATGHRAGKAVVRTGLDLSMGIHSPAGMPHRTALARLLHFDGLTRLQYIIKLLRRAHEPPTIMSQRHGASRIAQFEHLKGLMSEPALAADLVERLKSLTEHQRGALHAMDMLDEVPFRPAGTNPLQAGLTNRALDAELRRRYHSFLAEKAPILLTP